MVRDPVSKRTVVWEVIGMRDPDYIADMSVIAKLTYNDGLLADEQTALASVHALAALLVLLTGGLLAVTVSRRVSRPIEQLVEDVDAVAGGDLDHAIRPVAWYEFSTLAEKTGVMVDRLKEQIRQREESEQRFSDLVQLLPLGVFETDLDGNVTFANPAALEVVGIGVDELRRVLNISAVIAPEDRARARESFIAILDGGKTEGSEYTGRRSDGSTFSMLTYTSARYENGAIAGVRGSIVDISRLKQIEEEMRRMNAELEERVAQRTQELEAFTYSVSHDLRAPLRAIDGYSAILYEVIGPKLEEKDKRYLDQVRGIVRQMNGLIDGLLALSRVDRQELTCERISPAPLVREVVAVVLEQEPDHTVTVTVGDLPPCRADRAMLRQVYANLIGNAVKFSRHADAPRVEVGATGEGAETVYFVRDNGVGFEMADAETDLQAVPAPAQVGPVRGVRDRPCHGGPDRPAARGSGLGRIHAGRGVDVLLHPAVGVNRGRHRAVIGKKQALNALALPESWPVEVPLASRCPDRVPIGFFAVRVRGAGRLEHGPAHPAGESPPASRRRTFDRPGPHGSRRRIRRASRPAHRDRRRSRRGRV